MKTKGWILTVAIIIICSVIVILRNGNVVFGNTINNSVAITTQTQPGYHYVTQQITLSHEWSSMPVQLNNRQTMNYLIKRGQATEYEVRDRNTGRVYKFGPWQIIHTDMSPIYDWQWRVSGDITSGPVILEYTIGTFY